MNTTRPKKIIYLITKSNFGGAQKYVFELAQEAKRREYEVIVAAGGAGEAGATPGLLFEKLQSAHIKTKQIKNFMRNMSPLRDAKAFWEVWRLLRVEKPDVLHVTSSKAGGIGALAGQLAGIKKIVFTSHGLTVDETWRPAWQRFFIYWSTWLTLVLSHNSIMISTETYKRAASMPFLRDRVHKIFNGIENTSILDTTQAHQAIGLTLPLDAVVIGGIGELHTNKNWSTLIGALPLLPSNVHIVIIGEGEQRPALEKQIEDLEISERVHLLGFFAQAGQYANAFDIFILPSLKEGLPYVLLEAGLAARPVIASDLPGNRDIITHEQSGLLINPETEILAHSIQKLLDNHEMQIDLGKKLHTHVTRTFSMQQMCDQTFSRYQSDKS